MNKSHRYWFTETEFAVVLLISIFPIGSNPADVAAPENIHVCVHPVSAKARTQWIGGGDAPGAWRESGLAIPMERSGPTGSI